MYPQGYSVGARSATPGWSFPSWSLKGEWLTFDGVAWNDSKLVKLGFQSCASEKVDRGLGWAKRMELYKEVTEWPVVVRCGWS